MQKYPLNESGAVGRDNERKNIMNKILFSVVAATAIAGCTYYDYYKGGVRYTQDGKDCIYYTDEYARHYSASIDGIDGNNRIVYKIQNVKTCSRVTMRVAPRAMTGKLLFRQ